VQQPQRRAQPDDTAHTATAPGFRGWAARHPVATFLMLVFALAYPSITVWGLAYQA